MRLDVLFHPSLGSVPVWNPAEAAGAGATFAGVLGALVVAVTFQIADDDGRRRSAFNGPLSETSHRNKQSPKENGLSLLAAPISLVLLLAAAYTYVVLSGTNETSQRIIGSCQRPTNLCDVAYLKISAAMFSLGGSFLGAGAVALLFTLTLVARENSRLARHTFSVDLLLVTVSFIAAAALVWGYRDAQWLFDGKKQAIPSFIFSNYRYLWLIGGVVTGAGLGSYVVVRASRTTSVKPRRHMAVNEAKVASRDEGGNHRRCLRCAFTGSRLLMEKLAAFTGGAAYLTVLFIWFLRVQDTGHTTVALGRAANQDLPRRLQLFTNEEPIGAGFMTSFCVAWSAAFISAVLAIWAGQIIVDKRSDPGRHRGGLS